MKAVIVNAFNAMKEESKQLNGQTIHRLAKLEGTMSNSAQIETLHDVIAIKNELIKLLRNTKGFEKELKRPNVTKITDVLSAPQKHFSQKERVQ